jgi:hypothetical protein
VDAAREAVALGYAVSEPAQFAAALRQAGDLLAGGSATDDTGLAADLGQIAETLTKLTTPAPPPPPPGPPPTQVPLSTAGISVFEPPESFSMPESFGPPPFTPPGPVIPIEDLAPAPPPGMDLEEPSPGDLAALFGISDEPGPAPEPEPVEPPYARQRKRPMPPLVLTERSEVPTETPDLVGSWLVYERMLAAGIGPASLDVLMGVAAEPAAPALDTTRPTPPSFAAPALSTLEVTTPPPAPAPAPVAPPAPVELPIVDVQTLVYRGRRALERAQELRQLARRTPPDELPALFEEVCDLVVLALESGS